MFDMVCINNLIQSLVANNKHQSINTTRSRKVCLIGMLVKFCNRSFNLEGVNWAIQFHQHMLYICINLIFYVNLMVSLHVYMVTRCQGSVRVWIFYFKIGSFSEPCTLKLTRVKQLPQAELSWLKGAKEE